MSKMKDNLKKFLPLPARWQVQQNKYLISKMDSIEMQLKEIVSRTSTENVENSYKNSPPLQGLNESLQILNMDKSITDLQYFKVVLFGVGNYHKRVLKYFFAANINVAYFIDNKTDNTLQPSPYNILDPEVLLSEDKTKLKIIIMYDFPKYETIEEQLRKMGFYDCIYQTKVTCCTKLLHNITFIGGKIGFCCASSSNFNTSRPSFPYLDTSEKTIVDVLKKRKTIIRELTKGEKLTIAKPCENCSKLTSENYLFGLKEIKSINISCYPSICQARCFFCSVYKNPRNNYEASKDSNYPKMIAEMLRWLNVNDHITNRCSFTVAPAEITIMPHKDFLLETISKNKARFFTNGFVFDNKIAQSMKDRKSIIQISIDAGTRKTFQKIKGLDMYEKVVNNLLEYRKYGDIDLKYVIIPGVNDNDEDING
ncbi:MAG: radical SAM protein, partial [Defluviitaleaceae bacterium]|nr:radical SAM protein [Defluviitaleaceae bacterium]